MGKTTTTLRARKLIDWDTLHEVYDPMSVLGYVVGEAEAEVRREGGSKVRIDRVSIFVEVEGIYES